VLIPQVKHNINKAGAYSEDLKVMVGDGVNVNINAFKTKKVNLFKIKTKEESARMESKSVKTQPDSRRFETLTTFTREDQEV